jgi:hypothetical protein
MISIACTFQILVNIDCIPKLKYMYQTICSVIIFQYTYRELFNALVTT